MSKGISNIEIKNLFKQINNDDLSENFLGVYPSDKINKFIRFEKMMPRKKYPFLISDTDRSDQGGTHWSNKMNISPKSRLFFDSYGIEEIVNDDKIVRKILKWMKTIDQKDKKLTLCKLRFSINSYERLKENKIKKLSKTNN